MEKVNLKHQAFCREYIKDFNATKAAMRAGYSAKSAYSIGQRLLKNAEIQAELKRLLAPAEEAAGLTADKLCKEIGRISYSNIKNFHDEKGNPIPIQKLPDEIAACISSIDYDIEMLIDENGITKPFRYIKKIRLWDKNKAHDLAARILKMLDERTPDKDDSQINALLTFLKGGDK